MASASADTFHVKRVGDQLRVRSQAAWAAGGKVLPPVRFSPAGEIVAFVSVGSGIELARWTAGGKLVSRRAVDLAGKLLDWRFQPDGAVVAVTATAVVRLGPDGRIATRRAVPTRDEQPLFGSAYRAGAWVAYAHRVVHVALEGEAAEVTLPLGSTAEACRGESEKDCRARIGVSGLVASDDGSCLVVEEIEVWHAVSGVPSGDTTSTLALALVDGAGKVQARGEVGKARREREWFWREKLPSNPTPFPSDFGLVRTRYHGESHLSSLDVLANGDFLLGGWPEAVFRLDRGLRVLWGTGVPVPEVMGEGRNGELLLRIGQHGRWYLLDAGGKDRTPEAASYPEPEGRARARGALRQDGDGTWVFVSW